ncbi:MAG TPA: CheR family methyltransferase [Tepidisphaeraceae bacterium]|nr:CheR family methyltransferase [Tepidisphaeraceae bacterium]
MYAVTKSAKFRHVVFADDVGGPTRALDLTRRTDAGGPVGATATAAGGGADASATPGGHLFDDEHALVAWVFEQGGLDVRDYKLETLRRRLPAMLRAVRARDARAGRAALQRTPSLVHAAVNALVIGVTSFFRDPSVFAHLAEAVVPELAARSVGPRVWSVGCSDGSELYSAGILLAEGGVAHRSYLLGTDCRADAVRHASAGVYDAAAVGSVPPPLLDRYFRPFAGDAGGDGRAAIPRTWQVAPWLRTLAQFRRADVLNLVEPGQFDLVLCRNMSIYFQPAACERLWRSLEAALRPGGTLVVGKAERPVGAATLVPTHPGVYRRLRG